MIYIWIIRSLVAASYFYVIMAIKCRNIKQFGYNVAKCQNRGLTYVPSNLPRNLHKIYLDNNKISRLLGTPFSKFHNLKELHLKNNSMKYIGKDAFQGLKRLELLDLKDNQLIAVPTATLQHIPNLTVLILRNNNLTYIDDYAFNGLLHLEHMYISHNKIVNIAPKGLASLKRLKWFYINDNLLRTLDPQTLTDLRQLKVIRLFNNRWQCDCSLRWLKDWLMEIKKTRKVNWRFRDNEPICRSPPQIEGSKFYDLPAEKFSCPAHISNSGKLLIVDNKGDDARLECDVVGDPQPTISWYKNGYIIVNDQSERYNISMHYGNTIISRILISNFQKDDIARYTCVATNQGGSHNITYIVGLKGANKRIQLPHSPIMYNEPSHVITQPPRSYNRLFSPISTTTIIAAIAGCIILIMATVLILSIILCHRKKRESSSKTIETETKVIPAPANDYRCYEDTIKCAQVTPMYDDQQYDILRDSRCVDLQNKPHYYTYVSFQSDPDDLSNCYVAARAPILTPQYDSQTESTSPLLEGYRMTAPSPHFTDEVLHCTDYSHTLPHMLPLVTDEPNDIRYVRRSVSVEGLINMTPPKKPPRLHTSNDNSPEHKGYLMKTSVGRMAGTPL